ncbi:hypothetical protein [Rhodobacter ferrooxidans]|uniref:Uncharacterized protein n=1 Tax=Rhodobacter ferrooxidans TaxID=371731 RepID=C8RZ12_9RHOB|nr:hypothetical protein [Rhodobacter sp. SW2]EEW25969.1 conserved hypothetical protein [Rhodobacter sp. SW2]
MNMTWLVRMARWARHPPSWGRVKLVAGVVAACLVLVVLEKFIGWPDWLAVNRLPRH